MSQSVAEVLIITLTALGAGLLMFIAGVLQRIMNELDELEFKRFMNLLDKTAMSDPFAVTIATVPILAAIAYWVAYGFSHWWFTAGLGVWMVGSTMTKVVNMPVYQWVADPKHVDPAELGQQRRKLQLGNNMRAWTTLGSVMLMACQFGVVEVALTIAVCAIITPALLWLARRYQPGVTPAVSG